MECMWGYFQNCEILKFHFNQCSDNYNTYIGVGAQAKILKPSTDMYPVLHLSDQWKKKEWAGDQDEEKLKKRTLWVFKLNDTSAQVEKQNYDKGLLKFLFLQG